MFYKGPRPIKYDGNILMAINGLYNGKYYVRSKPGTATIGGVYYNNGDPANGVYNNVYYSNGTPGTGSFGGLYYVNGSKFTGYVSGNYYNSGNIITSDGSRTWGVSSNLFLVNNSPSVLLDDGRILFAGGFDSYLTSTVTNQWEIYDPARAFVVVEFGIDGSSSNRTAPLPGAVCQNTLIKLTNGKVVSIGGQSNAADKFNRRQETYLLDPTKIGTNEACWSTSLSLPSTEVGFESLIQLIPGTNKIIITGGSYWQNAFTQVNGSKGYILDYDANTVTQIANMPFGRGKHCGAFLPNGTYMIWGGNSTGGDSGNAYSYNFDTNTWTFLKYSGANSALTNTNTHLVNDADVFFIAAENGSTTYIKKYTLSSNNFTGFSSSAFLQSGENYPDQKVKSILLSNGTFLIYGGNNTTNSNGLVGIYDPVANNFDNLSNSGLVNAQAVAYPNIPNLILLTNNKLFATNGKGFNVMNF